MLFFDWVLFLMFLIPSLYGYETLDRPDPFAAQVRPPEIRQMVRSNPSPDLNCARVILGVAVTAYFEECE